MSRPVQPQTYMTKKGVPLYVFIVLVFSEVCDAFAQYCFKRSAMGLGSMSVTSLGDVGHFLRAAFGNGYLGLGIAVVSFVFVLWLTVLSKVDLSIAMPLTSCSYIFVAVTSVVFLHEHISVLRWCGIGLILTGVVIVTRSAEAPEKVEWRR